MFTWLPDSVHPLLISAYQQAFSSSDLQTKPQNITMLTADSIIFLKKMLIHEKQTSSEIGRKVNFFQKYFIYFR